MTIPYRDENVLYFVCTNVNILVVTFNIIFQDVRTLGKEYMGYLSYFLQKYLNLQVSQNENILMLRKLSTIMWKWGPQILDIKQDFT